MVMVSKPKEGQFEKTIWSDKVFTGDNNKNAATLTYYARQREQKQAANDRIKGRVANEDGTVFDRLYKSE